MSIELPFGNTSQARRCPLCKSSARVHPIAAKHMPGGYDRQVSCERYGAGCEYSEPYETVRRADQLMVSADNLAVLSEYQGGVMPGYLARHMMRRRRGA